MIGGKRSHQTCLTKFTCQEDRGRAVCTTDDGDSSRSLIVESHEDSHEVSAVDTELSSCTEQEALRVSDQRTEVCHRTDTHEDEGW